MKRLIGVIATLSLAVTVCGCKKNEPADGERITMNWMIMTQQQADSSMVWEKFNNELEKIMPGVSVNFIPCVQSEYKQKYDLALAGGQEIDLAFGADWVINLVNEVEQGAIMPLDELIKEHGSKLYDSLDKWMWELATVGDHIYAVPNNYAMSRGKFGMVTPKKYADKYLDVEKLQGVFFSQDTFNEACYDAIEEYLQKLKENNELQKGINVTYMPGCDFKGYDTVGDRLYVKRGDDSYKVQYKWMIPESRLMFEKCREFYEKGFVRKDMLSLEQPRSDEGKQDGYTVWFTQYNTPDYDKTMSAQYGFEVVSIPVDPNYYIAGNATPITCTIIPYTAKYPEKAVELMQLLFTEDGKDLYNLLTFGIEGTHYKKIDEETIKPLDYAITPTAESKYGLPKYMCGSVFNAYKLQDEPEGYNDFIKEVMNDASVKSPLLGFRCDMKNIKTESDQLQAISSEYLLPLTTGAVSDWEAQYKQWMNKLNSAGVEKIVDEVQNQINEFAAKKR